MAFITNPSSMHVEVALQAAKAGCHLFIEKPLGSNTDDVEELINIVEQQKLVALVAYQLRFHPGLKQVSKWLKEGRIGQPAWAHLVHGEFLPNFHPYEDYRIGYAARKTLGGGVILTQIHEFDYALWLFGKPRRIFAMGGKVSDLEIDVEDSASVIMECVVGNTSVPVSLCLDYLQSPPHRTCTIVGDKGRIVWDFHDSKKAILEDRVTGKTEELDFQHFEIQQIYIDELQHFLDAALGKVLPVVDLRAGHESLQMALAAHRSIETGKLVTL
jgi:predicted dehydrogenase